MAMENVQKLKIILLGDSGVGKTSLIYQYVFKKFQNKPMDFQDPLSKDIEVNNKNVTLQIYDTGGRERQGAGGFEAAFFSDAKGCMLVYDVNVPNSLDNLENWHNEFITRVISNPSSSKSFPFIVLGNKADTDGGGRSKEVYHERARKWCESKGIAHFLTSAKDNKYVAEAFLRVAQLALNHETKYNGTQENVPTVTVTATACPRPPPQPVSQTGGNQDPHNINNFPPTYQNSKTSKPPLNGSQYNYPNGKPHDSQNSPISSKPPPSPPPQKKSCCTIL